MEKLILGFQPEENVPEKEKNPEEIIAITETDGGISEEVEVENIELVEDGE